MNNCLFTRFSSLHSKVSSKELMSWQDLVISASKDVNIHKPISSSVSDIKKAKVQLPAIASHDCPFKTKDEVVSHNRFTLLWIDIDKGNQEINSITDRLKSLDFNSFIVHSTYSAQRGDKKWRVLIELDAALSFDRWHKLQTVLSRILGGDEAAIRPQQILFLPAKQGESAFYQYHIEEGSPWRYDSMSEELKLAVVLLESEPAEEQLIREAQCAPIKNHDLPPQQAGIIDLVNHAYDLEQTLAYYNYKKQGNKWLHPKSESGEAGVIVKDGRYYSFHSNDPLSDGYRHDVFDVIVQSRFGGNAKEAVHVLANELDSEGQKNRQREYMQNQAVGVSNGQVIEPDIIPLVVDLPEVESFDYGLLPESLRPWISDIQERVQCPPDFLAIGCMIGMAGLVGRKVGVYPKQKDVWLVIPNLWGAMIGRPSIMKTPALNEVLKPIYHLIKKEEERYQKQQLDYEVEKTEIEMRKKVAESELKKALNGKGKDALRNAELAKENLREVLEKECECMPVESRIIVNDATVEALGVKLNENPNGLLLVRDEMVGWIKGLDREDKANDKAFYLECFNGSGFYAYDRIGRGTIKIESTTVSIIGGIQPAKLSPYLAQAVSMGTNDDGFIQRFQLAVYPDDNKDWRNVDRYPDKEAKERAFVLFEQLHAMDPKRTEEGEVFGLRFTPDAQSLFDQWRKELENEIRSDDIHPAVESHLAKYRSLIPSLALLLELADSPESQVVSLSALNKAIEWGVYLKSHMLRIYNGAIETDVIAAKKILDSHAKLPERFKVREVTQKGWTGLKATKDVKASLSVLVEHGYLIEEVSTMTGGRPSESYRWNQSLNLKDKR